MPVGEAAFEDGKQGVTVNAANALGKMIRKLLGPFRPPQADLLAASAGAVAGEHRHSVLLLVFTAIGNAFVVVLKTTFFQAATTSVIGPPLG